ncbi:MAG: SBBP repeat-containing protein, partial [Candidatus Omnitrophota bacterium]
MKTKQILITLLLFTSTFLYAQTPKFQWVKGGGSGGSATNSGLMESCKWINTDAHGNIYGMSSIFSPSIHIDTSYKPSSYGFDDFAVFSYRCDGSLRWVRYFGSTTNDTPKGMFTDSNGNTFVIGQVAVWNNGNSYFGDSTVLATTAMAKSYFIAKIDSTGHTCWLSLPGPAFPTSLNTSYFLSIKPDNQGNLCVLTLYGSIVNLGAFTIPGKGYYVVKFDKSNGNVIGLTKLDYSGRHTSGINFEIDHDNSCFLFDGLGYPDTLFIGSNVLACENDS